MTPLNVHPDPGQPQTPPANKNARNRTHEHRTGPPPVVTDPAEPPAHAHARALSLPANQPAGSNPPQPQARSGFAPPQYGEGGLPLTLDALDGGAHFQLYAAAPGAPPLATAAAASSAAQTAKWAILGNPEAAISVQANSAPRSVVGLLSQFPA